MKCLITGDWHLGLLTHGVQQPDGFNSRMKDLNTVICRLFGSTEADCFIHLGDLFHTNTPSPAALAMAAGLLNFISKKFEHSFFIGGNHDYAVTRVNPLEIFSKLSNNIDFIVKPKEITVDFDREQFVFIPHSNDIDLHEFLKSLPTTNKYRSVFCHTTFSGALTGSEDFMLAAGVHPIPRDIAPIIFSGHIHKAQVLKSNQPGMADVYYPGSPMILDFGERKDKKIALLYDTETRKVTDIDLIEPRKFIQLDTVDYTKWPDVADAVVKVVVSGPCDPDQIAKTLRANRVHSIAGIKSIQDVQIEKLKQESLKLDDKQLMWNYLVQKLGDAEAREAWNLAWGYVAKAGVEIK